MKKKIKKNCIQIHDSAKCITFSDKTQSFEQINAKKKCINQILIQSMRVSMCIKCICARLFFIIFFFFKTRWKEREYLMLLIWKERKKFYFKLLKTRGIARKKEIEIYVYRVFTHGPNTIKLLIAGSKLLWVGFFYLLLF